MLVPAQGRNVIMQQICRLVYLSTAARVLSFADLEHIEARSQEHNKARNVTGLLIYNGTNFMQQLEGPEQAVAATFERISCDDRHAGIRLIAREAVAKRAFPDWWMHLVKVRQDATDLQSLLPGALPQDLQHAFSSIARLTAN